ncbi:hypothetical protein [Klebsiella aerogenes]|uniref:hypothetical protein n=1 Tax=Klebsiella aerogenes TaxID=548 RepID=UPI0035160537|nr:hypothetical protein [Klebsiella aerogenes]
MSEGKFWLSILALFVVAVAVITAGVTACSIHEDNAISAAINKGINPIDAYCAYNGGDNHPKAQCVLRSAK